MSTQRTVRAAEEMFRRYGLTTLDKRQNCHIVYRVRDQRGNEFSVTVPVSAGDKNSMKHLEANVRKMIRERGGEV